MTADLDAIEAQEAAAAWRVVDARHGAVRSVAVEPITGGWRATVTGGGLEGLANESSKSARRAVTALAVRAGWEPAEILAPGEPTRAEAIDAALRAERASHAAEVAAAVAAEREARETWQATPPWSDAKDRAHREHRVALAHLDALLSAAPAPSTVPAALVRAYLAALTIHRRALASAMQPCISDPLAVTEARAALEAALAGCP